MGLSSILTTATSGLQAVQTQMQWRTDNISNAQDPSYSRRDATTVSLGTHTVTVNVARAVDNSVQDQFLSSNSLSTASSAQQDYFQRIGDILGTSQSTPYLQQALDDFTGAWKSFETDTASTTSESEIVRTGSALATYMNQSAQQLDQLETEARTGVAATVTDLNNKLVDLDAINKKLSAEPLAQTINPGLYDQRDSLVKDISSIVSVVRIQHPDGTIALYSKNGTALVDHAVNQFQWNNSIGSPGWISMAPPASIGTAPGLNAGFIDGKLGTSLNLLDNSASALASSDPTVGTLAKARAQLNIVATQLSDNVVSPTAAQPQLNTFGGAYYYAQPDRPTDLMGGPTATWPGPPPSSNVAMLTTVPPTAMSTPMSSFFVIDNGLPGPPAQAPMLTPSDTFAVNPSLLDGSATIKRQAASGVIAALTDASRTMTIAQTVAGGAAGKTVTLPQTYGLVPGMTVTGTGVPAGVTVQSVAPLTGVVTLSGTVGVPANTTLNFGLNCVSVANQTYSGLFASVASYQTNSQANATANNTRLTTTTQTLDTRYNSTVGVNMDTEMAQLTVLQNSYAANARVINTVQTLFDDLLGVVK